MQAADFRQDWMFLGKSNQVNHARLANSETTHNGEARKNWQVVL
jgi:hypothetical protein